MTSRQRYTTERPSLASLAATRPIRFVLQQAVTFAGSSALALLLVQVINGPPAFQHPGRELAVLLGFGVLAGIVMRRGVLKASGDAPGAA